MNIFNKVKSLVGSAKTAVVAPAVGASMCFATAVPTLAAETADSSSIVSTLTSSMSSIASDCMTAITSILPIALPIVGVGVVIGLGVKYLKRITNKG